MVRSHPLRAAWRPFVFALLGPLALLAAPGDQFLRIERFELYDGVDAGPMVAMQRFVWPEGPLSATWSARVEEVGDALDPDAGRRLLCVGGGAGPIGAEVNEHLHVPLPQWLGRDDCPLSRGRSYVLTTVWRFSLLGVPKTVTSSAVAAPFEPVAVRGRS